MIWPCWTCTEYGNSKIAQECVQIATSLLQTLKLDFHRHFTDTRKDWTAYIAGRRMFQISTKALRQNSAWHVWEKQDSVDGEVQFVEHPVLSLTDFRMTFPKLLTLTFSLPPDTLFHSSVILFTGFHTIFVCLFFYSLSVSSVKIWVPWEQRS